MFITLNSLLAMRSKNLFCIAVLLLFTINNLLGQTYEKLPYFEGFEDSITYSSWTLNAGPNASKAENKWYISNAEAFVGENALYISSDGGKTLSYNNQDVYVVACKEIFLPVGVYDLSFIWKSEGEIGADGFYVCWVPEGVDINTSLNGEPSMLRNNKLKFENGIELLCGEKEWKTSVVTINQEINIKSKLVFVWKNDSKGGANGSVVIDNIQIAKQNCSKPSNLSVSVSGKDVELRWNGSGNSFDLQYRIYGEDVLHRVNGIIGNVYVISNVEFGVYDFFVRSCCDNDTSVWIDKKEVLVYDALAEGCIDYINLLDKGVECSIGLHETGGYFTSNGKFVPKIISGSQKVGCIDKGSDSELSHHTIHYKPGEVDARTNGGLPTVPEGQVASVRLGNWLGGYEEGFSRGGFESITYTHQLDSGSNEILLLNYAIVIEDPGHGITDNFLISDQPVFMLELLDEEGNSLSENGCGDANFMADTKLLLGGNTTDGTWHIETNGVGTPILWKEWTSVGVNLSSYSKNASTAIKVRLSTYDCARGEHFGYAYFTLQCLQATIKSSSCGDSAADEIKAPDGFDYRWYRKNDGATACKTQKLQVLEENDTSVYVCKMMFKQDSTCYFEQEVNIMPRYAKPQFYTKWIPRNCDQNRMEFINTSCIRTSKGATTEKCDTLVWHLREKGGNEWQKVHVGDRLWSYDFPKEGGEFEIWLQAGIIGANGKECLEDTIVSITIPEIGPESDTLSVVICEGEVYRHKYKESGVYELYRGISTISGCDSVSYLDLKVVEKERDTIYAYICGGEKYDLNGQLFSRSGKYQGVNECQLEDCECGDTLVTLYLSVLDMFVESEMTICSGDSLSFDYEVKDGDFVSYQIIFDDDAKSAGLKDTEILSLPEGGRISLGLGDISDKTDSINPIRPGYYTFNLLFYYVDTNGESRYCEYLVDLTVLYSAEMLNQKFDNMIVLLNKENNGGYEFSYYRWYRNGELIVEGADSSFIYLTGQDVNPGDIYTVGLIRKGEEEEIMSCGISMSLGTDLDLIEESKAISLEGNIFDAGSVLVVNLNEYHCNYIVRWWSITGMLLEEVSVNPGENIIIPEQQGVYLLELEMENCRVIERIIIK